MTWLGHLDKVAILFTTATAPAVALGTDRLSAREGFCQIEVIERPT